jgi:hypothetical protein
MYAMAAAIKTWIQPLPDPDIKQKKSEGSRVPDYLIVLAEVK